MALNLALKIAIIESGRSQITLAAEIGIDNTKLSKIVNGHIQPSDDERAAIATALGRSAADLFPEVAA